MAIQDIVNANQGDYSLSPEQKFNIHSSTGMTPGELDQAAQDVSAYKDLSGLAMVPTTDTPKDLQMAQFAKAKNAFDTHGLGFKPPSKRQGLQQMLGTLFITYIGARLLGAEGKDSLALALVGASANHDMIQKQHENYQVILEELKRHPNLDPAAAMHFYETGDLKALEGDFKADQAEKDRLQDRQWSQEDAERAENWKREDAAQNHQYDMEGRKYTAAHSGRGRLGGAGVSAPVAILASEPTDSDYDTQMKRNIAEKNAKGKPLNMEELGYLQHKQAAGSAPSQLVRLTGDYKQDHSALSAINNYRTRNQTMENVAQKTKAAEARLQAVDTSKPMGQLAAEYQFLTVEAPTIGNSVATASGVSNEAIDGWQDQINQLLQKWSSKGSLTPKEADELRTVAKQEADAIRKVKETQDLMFARGYDLTDPQTRQAILGATDLTTDDLDRIVAEQKSLGIQDGATSSAHTSSAKTVDFNSLPK